MIQNHDADDYCFRDFFDAVVDMILLMFYVEVFRFNCNLLDLFFTVSFVFYFNDAYPIETL